jgi:hypothetical protein
MNQFSKNSQDMAWCEWLSAAMPSGWQCCGPNAWGQCVDTCTRIHPSKAPAHLIEAWKAGEDPTEWRAAFTPMHNAERYSAIRLPCTSGILLQFPTAVRMNAWLEMMRKNYNSDQFSPHIDKTFLRVCY